MLSTLSVDGRTAMWEQVLGQPATSASTVVYVIEVDRKIIGLGSCGSQRTATLKERGYDAEVNAIYVLKAFQRRAVGTRLLSTMASNLSARGFSALSLWVLRDNNVARRFYERHGGQMIAERDDVRANGVLIEVAYGWMDLAELVQPQSAVAAAGDSIDDRR
jgi:ribosomal protein S18 acetylase RimI-like enzyme